MVLMAVFDAHYVFTLVNVGDFGSNNDSGVLENSTMDKAFASNQMGLPDEEDHCHISLLGMIFLH